MNDLISLSKIEQYDEKKEIKFQERPIITVLENAIGSLREKANEKELTIDVDCQVDISAKIDSILLEQAIGNLLDNAINYSHEKSEVQVSALQKDDSVVINVQDHGVGISKEHLSRLFERFYRVDKARSRNHGGTGLGLAIVKHIAQAHGGHVSVDSLLGCYLNGYFGFDFLVNPDGNFKTADFFDRFFQENHSFFHDDILVCQSINYISCTDGSVETIFFINNIAEIDTNAKFHPTIFRQLCVKGFKFILHHHRTLHGIDDTGELGQHIITW